MKPGQTYRFVSIGFNDRWAAGIVKHPTAADDPMLRFLTLGSNSAFCGSFSLSHDVMRLLQSYFSGQITGACGVLIAEARALEIIAAIAKDIAGAADMPRGAGAEPKISAGDVERLNEAKSLIEGEPEVAFTLPVLARRVDININKLKAGFKLLFGRTVGEHAEHAAHVRMAHAHHLLTEEGLQVASVAYRLGYTPTHFAIAFRRRYGVLPSRVIR